MVDPAVGRRYAEAYLNTLEASCQVETGLAALKLVSQTYTGSKDLQRFLGSPEIGSEDKEQLLTRLFGESAGAEAMELLKLLLRWDRVDHLPILCEEAIRVAEARRGMIRGAAITAHPISAAETEALARAVGGLLGKQVILERRVEPQLIGGVRVVVGTAILDGSIQTRLEEVRRQLMEVKVN